MAWTLGVGGFAGLSRQMVLIVSGMGVMVGVIVVFELHRPGS